MHCATKLEPGAAVSREVRKTVTVLFCDIAGSTAIGERVDAETVRKTMSRFFEEVRAVLERHGGTVEKFIGDAVMAVFGIPVAHEDDATRAVRAAAELQHAVDRLNEEVQQALGTPIRVRTGINTGEVVTGDPAAGQALVVGDPVNVAARLEQAAGPGEVLLGTSTYELVRYTATATALDPLELKGKRDPVRAYRLESVGPPEARRILGSALVGRGEELDTIRDWFEGAASERACRLLSIFGSAGLGKSRLAQEFVGAIGTDAIVLTGRCLPYGEGITFWPITELIRQACGITDDATNEEAREKIAAATRGAEDEEVIAERVAEVAGFSEATSGLRETFWGIRRFLEWQARVRPVAVILDDLHWAEPTLLDLVEYLAGWSRDAAILLLCLARPELLETRPSWPTGAVEAASIHLSPLTPVETEELIGNILEPALLEPATRERIAAAGEGNPLFVEELLRMLEDDALLRRDGDEWKVAGDLSAVQVPPTIHALLSARLDRLDPEERAVIGSAAVVGKEFWWGAVAELSPVEMHPRVGAHLQTLVRKELIRPDRSSLVGEDAYRFHHILIQEAAYRATPKSVRADLHERFADWLQSAPGDRILEVEEILGYHLEQAYRYRAELGETGNGLPGLAGRAFAKLSAAGRRALARGDVSAAVKLLRRAAALPIEADTERTSVKPELAEALMEVGDLSEAASVIEEAIDDAERAGLSGLHAHAVVVRLLLMGMTDPKERSRAALGQLDEVIPTFEELGDDLGLARSWRLLSEVHMNRARYADADDALERAVRHARRAGAAWEEAESLGQFAGSGAFGPAPVPEVIRRCELILTQAAGNRTAEARALRALGTMRAMEGDFDEARELVRRGQTMLEDLGLRLRAAFVSETLGFIERLAGDDEAAERVLRDGYAVIERFQERGYLSTLAALLAHALVAQGDEDEADGFTKVSEETAAEDDLSSQVLWRSARALVLARRGDADVARDLIERGVLIADSTDDINMRADTLLELSEVSRVAGRVGEAADAARHALDLYQRKGNQVSAAAAEARVASLVGAASEGVGPPA
ncbi:MAG TPA: adenylate/guanylate cyclase domain-containing protein [Actinomycetota bacterium]|nr:adenylate/guanylate cyclase domain-containing protein [Actinomycetota bacterium]